MRLLLVTRRFWPLVGGAEIAMSRLATGFQRRGHDVTIVTACWEEHWPKELVHQEVQVVRLPQPRQRLWGTWRYMRHLARWFRAEGHRFDAALVSMLKHDAYVAVGALPDQGCSVVLRAEGGGPQGDCTWQAQARFGSRIQARCWQAAATIAPTPAIYDELVAAHYPVDRLHTVFNGAPLPDRHVSRENARQALGAVNHDLAADATIPVIVYTGRLDEAKGLADAVRAWPRVLQAQPQAQLWLVGDGPYRDELFQLIKDHDLLGQVLLPGSFDDISDVLFAANAFLLPSYSEGLSLSLLEAIAHDLPVVASDIPGNRTVVTPEETGTLFPVKQPERLADAVVSVLNNQLDSQRLALEAKATVLQNYTVDAMVQGHLDVLAQTQSD